MDEPAEHRHAGGPPTARVTASQVIQRIARSDPDGVALQVGGERISFARLDDEVERLARRLAQEADAAPPGPAGAAAVVLWLDGLHAATTASLAVSRAGLVCVPVDPTTPPRRVRAIAQSVGAMLVLSDVDLGADLGAPAADPLDHGAAQPDEGTELPADAPRRSVAAPAPPLSRRSPRVAAIVFTSGSTGEPKGIVLPIEQLPAIDDEAARAASGSEQGRALEDAAAQRRLRIGYLWAGTVGNFDSQIQRLLLFGGTIVGYELRREGVARLGRWLQRERVETCFTFTPTILRQLLSTLPAGLVFESLRMVSLTGETVTWEDVAALRSHLPPDGFVYSAYGLSETGLIAGFVVGSDTPLQQGPLPVGTPQPACEVQIIDPDGAELPPGRPGEIVVCGHDIALGYWRRPDLDAVCLQTLPDGRRRLRTGDRGLIGPDGTLEHLGRLDHMVKIAGNRVELGEIESLLRRLHGVAEAAAVTYRDGSQALRLAAYVSPLPGRELDPERLRAELAAELPRALMPDRVEVLERIPMLANGKVDRRSLPSPAPPAGGRLGTPGSASPVDHPQARSLADELAAIWEEVLGVEGIGPEDDFFSLGGDSLRAARVFARLEDRLGLDRPISLLLQAPTIAQLAAAIESDSGWSGLVAIQPHGSRPPLFVVHDQFGNLFPMREIAAWLEEDQPVYGLRDPALHGERERAPSLEELAADYLAEIRQHHPHGPYLLYGHELGGLVAFEIALQLQRAGERVASLAVGFMPAPPPAPTLRARAGVLPSRARSALARRFRREAAPPDSSNGSASPVRGGGPDAPDSARGATTSELRAEHARLVHHEMARRYHPRALLRGSLLLVVPDPAVGDLGWERYVDGAVEVIRPPALRGALASLAVADALASSASA